MPTEKPHKRIQLPPDGVDEQTEEKRQHCGGRICNIQRDDMMLGSDKGAAYVELIDRLSQRVQEEGRKAWYMDKLMWENLCVIYSRLSRGNAITFHHVEARKEKRLYGIPVRIQDCMKVNEEKVPAVA